MQSKLCALCQKPALQKCSGCNEVFYCNKEHQKIDWKKSHKNNCAPYKTVTNDVIGRYLVATRDIREGSIIMRKKPLVLGPKLATHPLCLGCHKKLDHVYLCSKCKWPLCGRGCEDSLFHAEECKILENSKYAPQIDIGTNAKQTVYAPITILRSLILKRDTGSFSNLMTMQSHLDENMKSPVYNILKRTLVPLIKGTFKIDTDEKEILTICSILDTNAFDVRICDGLVNIRGLYPTVSLVAHDCTQNTKHIVEDDYQLVLMATVAIKKGEMITTSYTQPLWGTLNRRAHLRQVKHFECTCKRCRDPTEFGTYAGSMFCPNCKSNKNDSKIVSSNPLNRDADWMCESCDYKMAASEMALENESLKREICCLDKSDPEHLERFLCKHKRKLHEKNCHVLEVKYALSQMYGHMSGYTLNEITDKNLERKITLCKELLEVADALQPGLSKFRGTLLFDLQDATATKLKRQLNKGTITNDDFKKNLQNVLEILNEADEILSPEPGRKNILLQKLNDLKTLLAN